MIKKLLPQTLQGRTILIIVTPVVLLLMVTTLIFYERHWDTVTRRLGLGVAGELSLIVENLNDFTKAEVLDSYLKSVQRELLSDIHFNEGAIINSEEQYISVQNRILDTQLSQALRERIKERTRFDTTGQQDYIEILIQLDNGVLVAKVLRDRLTTRSTSVFILWMLGSSLILVSIAILFLRNQIRPIRSLASAADAFGKGRDVTDLKPSGAIEVRQAAQAFNTMRTRILQFVSQRTEMLAGVSHDLRTPLTRMRLETEMFADKNEVAALKSDISEMEAMVEGYLAFARNQDIEGSIEINLSEIMNLIARNARRQGASIKVNIRDEILMTLQPNSFRRCINNIVDNARRYAKYIEINAKRKEGFSEIKIDDDGPGIPESKLKEVLRPFRRVDESRNTETGGLGLGLAIASDVIRSHGGEIELSKSRLGGLSVLLKIPI